MAVINCTQYTTLKDLVSKLTVHSDINYKEWTKQLKHKMVQNVARKMDPNGTDDSKKESSSDDHKDSENDEVHSQIWILSDALSPNHRIERSTFPSSKEAQSAQSTQSKASQTSSPSDTPPPNDMVNEEKEDHPPSTTTNPKVTPFGYGINEEAAVSTKFHHVHSKRNATTSNRDHLSQSIHALHKQQLAASNANDTMSNGAGPTTSRSTKPHYKMDVMSCDVIIFHNVFSTHV